MSLSAGVWWSGGTYVEGAFGRLPLEIVDLIHSFCTRDLSAALRLVCKRFNEGHRWRRCRVRVSVGDAQVSELSRVLCGPALTRLSFAGCRNVSGDALARVLAGTNRLTRLDLSGMVVPRELVWQLATLVPHLRDLIAVFLQPVDRQPWQLRDFCQLQSLTALEKLDLPQWRDISFLSAGFTALRAIACRSMPALDDSPETRAVLPGLTQLTHISLARSGPVQVDFAQCIRTLRQLEFIDLSFTTVSDAGVRLLLVQFVATLTALICNSCRNLLRPFGHVQSASELPRLERVEFSECDLTAGHWMVLAQLTSLRRINASSCQLGNFRVAEFRALTQLTHLSLAGNKLSDEVLWSGLTRLTRLEKVNLIDNFFTDAGVGGIARTWPRVRELNLFGNDELTERGLFMLCGALMDAKIVPPFHLTAAEPSSRA